MPQTPPPFDQPSRRRRACDFCFSRKIRCLLDNSQPSSDSKKICIACKAGNRTCVFSIQARKFLTRNEFTKFVSKPTPPQARCPDNSRASQHSSSTQANGFRFTRGLGASSFPHSFSEDVVQKNIIPFNIAVAFFSHFKKEMLPNFPFIVFPTTFTCADLRQSKPSLFLAIMSAASSSSTAPGISSEERKKLECVLHREVAAEISYRVSFKGDKDLELVQALLVASSWPACSDTPRDSRISTWIAHASFMVVDLGLHIPRHVINESETPLTRKRMDSATDANADRHILKLSAFQKFDSALQQINSMPDCDDGVQSNSHNVPTPDIWEAARLLRTDSLESRRALVGCYIASIGSNAIIGRSRLVSYTYVMTDFINLVRASYTQPIPGIAPTDTVLADWLELSHIEDEFCSSFKLDGAIDDNSVIGSFLMDGASHGELFVEPVIEIFLHRLHDWRSNLRFLPNYNG